MYVCKLASTYKNAIRLKSRWRRHVSRSPDRLDSTIKPPTLHYRNVTLETLYHTNLNLNTNAHSSNRINEVRPRHSGD